MAFPENLRRIRLAQFFSQAELARRSGVHTVTIARLEAGTTAPSRASDSRTRCASSAS
jgi:predicted transcriptional regulator